MLVTEIIQYFTGNNFEKFYNLSLKATISNGWSFRWVDNVKASSLCAYGMGLSGL